MKSTARASGTNPLVSRIVRWGLLVGFLLVVGYFSLTTYVGSKLAIAITARDFPAARTQLKWLQSLSFDSASTALNQARIARLEGDAELFSNALQQASQAGADPHLIEVERLMSLAQQGYLDGVEQPLIEELLDPGANNFELCDAYANGLLANGRLEAADNVIKAWMADFPKSAVPAYRLARLREYGQNLAEAKELYLKAIQLDPRYFPASFALARLLLDENEPGEASKHFAQCQLMPHPAAAKIGLAMSQIKLGETDEAKRLLQEVCKLNATEIRESYRSVGEVYERHVAASELGKLLVADGEFAPALDVLNKALEFNDRDVSSRYSKSLALRGLNRIEEAEAESKIVKETEEALRDVNELRNLIQREPQNVDAMLKLGKLLIDYESERNGLFWLKNAISADGQSTAAHRALAEFYEARVDKHPEYSKLAREHREQLQRLEQR